LTDPRGALRATLSQHPVNNTCKEIEKRRQDENVKEELLARKCSTIQRKVWHGSTGHDRIAQEKV
jgi:hypothetical protein